MFEEFAYKNNRKRIIPSNSQLRVANKRVSYDPCQCDFKETKWLERYHDTCDECFDMRARCIHFKEMPLRLLLVGHNPSDHAWKSGYFYSNPSNRMWKLLTGNYSTKLRWRGIIPSDWCIEKQKIIPGLLGIGFTDLGEEPGNDASKYDRATMIRWKNDLFKRLQQHVERVNESLYGVSPSKSLNTQEACKCPYQHAPMMIAFTGKRQFAYLFEPPRKMIKFGKQSILPPEWPFSKLCEVWVLPSSSGRAVMTNKERCDPYIDLATQFHRKPWPIVQNP